MRLVFALHFHQPVGNFDSVFEEAVARCYSPVVDHFERHPSIPAAFHLTGCLLEWLEENDRRFLDRVLRLIDRGQIEPLGGGFYEPILSVIPRKDALEQLALLSDYWVKRAGVRPEGAWLAERVWEPALAEVFHEAGIRYTVLDDQHIRYSGLLEKHFSGIFTTERCARPVAFFPSDFQLRYLIPFRSLDTVRAHFEALLSERKDWVLTYGDDAEKFGLWPGTHKWVFEEKWLENFFTYLEGAAPGIAVCSPGTYMAEKPKSRRIYVPNASYTEMLEWALPPDSVPLYARTRKSASSGSTKEAVASFVRGSLWDMFFARYPESDRMHKHALRTSRLVSSAPESDPGRDEARRASLRAQCNCSYWHGLFGGVYLPHLRHGVYRNMLEADRWLAGRRKAGVVLVEAEDIDGDFEEEIILQSRPVQAFFRPARGGTMDELDYLPAAFNVTNTMSRWRESYHSGEDLTHKHDASGGVPSPHEMAVGPVSAGSRIFDTETLCSFLDFVSPSRPDPSSLCAFRGFCTGRNALGGLTITSNGFSGHTAIDGLVYEKRVSMSGEGTLTVLWTPSVSSQGWFGTVLYLSLLTGTAPDRSLLLSGPAGTNSAKPPATPQESSGVTRIRLADGYFGFAAVVESDRAVFAAAAPVETMQRCENGYESVYQGTLIALALPPGEFAPMRPLSVRVFFEKV